MLDPYSSKEYNACMRGFAHEAVLIMFGVLVIGGVSFGVPRLIDAAGADAQYDACVGRGTPASQCEQQWKQKIKSTCPDVGAVGQCSQDPDCKSYCTESGTSQGGINSCCKDGPKEKPHQPNKCPKEADGKCDPKKEDGKGGEPPKMPEIPKKENKPTEPKNPLDDKCEKMRALATSSPEYSSYTAADRLSCGINNISNSLNDLYKNIFGGGTSNSDSETATRTQDSSVEDILKSVTTEIKTAEDNAKAGATQAGSGVTQNQDLSNTALDPNLAKGNGQAGVSVGNTGNGKTTGVGSTFGDAVDTHLLPASDPGFLAQAQSVLTGIAAWLSATFTNLF